MCLFTELWNYFSLSKINFKEQITLNALLKKAVHSHI